MPSSSSWFQWPRPRQVQGNLAAGDGEPTGDGQQPEAQTLNSQRRAS
jgi:hypothetical protein